MENKEILLAIGEDGIAREYDNTYDVTIHCESKEDQEKLMSSLVIPIVGKTNGDMIKALMPNIEIRDFGSYVEGHSLNIEMRFSKSWWNAPYKENIDEKN